MKIHEYQAKEILKTYGIPVPEGAVADGLEAGLAASKKLGFPLMIKAQVHAGGRGKAGAIRAVSDPAVFKKELSAVLGMRVRGLRVDRVLLERLADIRKQFYLGITVDRSRQTNAIMASAEGGVEIEEVARTRPDRILNLSLKRSDGPEKEEIARLVSFLKLDRGMAGQFAAIAGSLFKAYMESDAQLAEINPLAVTGEGALIACDAKMVIDDNALFRRERLNGLKEEAEDNELEAEAHRRGLAYVKLKGDIGIIGNGAGLVMATMDEVKRAGGRPADFLDIGGGARSDVMKKSLEIIYMDADVKGVFINVFGGITRCDEVANGIVGVTKEAPRDIPIVLRLTGTRCEEGRRLLGKSDIVSAGTMEEGARRVVELVRKAVQWAS